MTKIITFGFTKYQEPHIVGLETELKEAIIKVKDYLVTLNFELPHLCKAIPMEKIGKLKEAADCINLNETTRTTFEMMPRNVFRKFKALYPEEQVKPYVKEYNGIEDIYGLLNQKVKSADFTEIMMELQALVSESIIIKGNDLNEPQEDVYIDLSTLDFEKLRAAFAKAPRKNTITYDLQRAIEKKLEQMLKENPLRIEFYDRYKEIIEEYNQGKFLENTIRAFEKLTDFLETLSVEEQRAVREQLEDQETLAIFDLLKDGKALNAKEKKEVKKVATQTLEKLKAEKHKIDRWRESRQITAQIKSMIYDNLLWLPQEVYTDEDVSLRTVNVYQHIYSNYSGGGKSVYQKSA